MRKARIMVTVVAAAAVAAAGFGVASAASSSTTFKACSTSSGALGLLKSGKCAKGSHKVSVGAQGPRGLRGARGPAGPLPTTLPSGKTETGAFALQAAAGASELGAISFTYPLRSDIGASHAPAVKTVGKSGDATHCTGSYESPKAAKGYLCLYLAFNANATSVTAYQLTGNSSGASRTGAVITFIADDSSAATIATGSYAVTAP